MLWDLEGSGPQGHTEGEERICVEWGRRQDFAEGEEDHCVRGCTDTATPRTSRGRPCV